MSEEVVTDRGEEVSHEDTKNEAQPTASTGVVGLENLNDRLFQLRMKINQGRKANQNEVDEEYKRINNHKNRKYSNKDSNNDGQQEGADGENNTEYKKKNKKKVDLNDKNTLLQQTALEAEWEAKKQLHKSEIAATYGLNAFTNDANYRAYEKRCDKLERIHQHKIKTEKKNGSAEEDNEDDEEKSALIDPLSYGQVNAKVSQDALERLKEDVIEKEAQRKKFSKRRLAMEESEVNYINSKNATFNKKLKKAFDKYTVEIRQNLERGTAI